MGSIQLMPRSSGWSVEERGHAPTVPGVRLTATRARRPGWRVRFADVERCREAADGGRAPYDPMPHGPAEVGVGPVGGRRGRRASSTTRAARRGRPAQRGGPLPLLDVEAIVADLDTRRHDFHVAIENWQHDFNIGTIVRSANAFLAAEVHIVGNRRWNRRGAMVTDRYQHVRHHATAAELAAYLHEHGGR